MHRDVQVSREGSSPERLRPSSVQASIHSESREDSPGMQPLTDRGKYRIFIPVTSIASFTRNVFHHFQSEAGDTVHDLGCTQHTHPAHPEIGDDLRAHAVGAQFRRLPFPR